VEPWEYVVVPAGQAEQELEAVVEYVPISQMSQFKLPSSLNFPDEQTAHELAVNPPEGLFSPLGHM
jgi:hypothetical protein